jgi:UDP-arabinose 4-epimerase
MGPLIERDILDTERLTSAMRDARPDAVAHFAALVYVGESVADPGKYYRVNSAGALDILDAMRACDVTSIVFSSNCATYGAPVRTPIDQDHPQVPINPYGWSKLIVEKMLADHDRAHGICHVALRYLNAAGADPDGAIGERHEPETHVIPLPIRSPMQDDYACTIHGGDYETRDGSAVRDYIHASDLADAHLKALDRLCAGGGSDVFNLGTGVGTSVMDIADAVERAASRSIARTVGPRREDDPPALVANADKAARQLNWRPQRSSIDAIITDASRWHQSDADCAVRATPAATP